MEHGTTGGYDNNSALQKSITSTLSTYLDEVIQKLDNEDETLFIMDCGCSQGGLTIANIKRLLSGVKDNTKVHLYFSDTSSNDWKTAFMKGDSLAKSSNDRFTFSGIGKSFFDRLLPEKHLNLVLSSNTLHWTSETPESDYYWTDGNYLLNTNETLDKQRALARRDFSMFLDCRSKEVKAGGFLLASIGVKDPDKLESSYGFYEFVDKALDEMVREKKLGRDFATKYSLPMVICPIEDRLKVIRSKASEWNLVKWRMEHNEMPHYKQYSVDHDLDAFANAIIAETKAFLGPILKHHLIDYGIENIDQWLEEYDNHLKSAFISYPDKERNLKYGSNLTVLLRRV